MDGFKKMYDEIMKKNTTANFLVTSIFYGGASQANLPQFLTRDTLTTTQKDIMTHLRSNNPHMGLFYTSG